MAIRGRNTYGAQIDLEEEDLEERRYSMLNHIKISKNFHLSEFECPCCHLVKLDPKLLEKLQHLRDLIDAPLYVSSGYRCPKENARVGGVPHSYHLYGMAADVYTKTIPLERLLEFAAQVGFNGIGYYPRRNFLHLDVREKPYFWKGE